MRIGVWNAYNMRMIEKKELEYTPATVQTGRGTPPVEKVYF